MIGAIGFQRFFVILALFVIAVGLGVANFYYLKPQEQKISQELAGITSEESMLRTEVETMRTGMATFKRQQVLFDRIGEDGFFNLQDRVVARENLNSLQKESRAVALKYEISAASMSLPEGVSDDKYALLTSPLSIEISAIDDIDIYRFISLLIYQFPGLVNIKSLNIESEKKVTTDILRDISSGIATVLVSADIEADWITVAPHGTAPWADNVDMSLIQSSGGTQ